MSEPAEHPAESTGANTSAAAGARGARVNMAFAILRTYVRLSVLEVAGVWALSLGLFNAGYVQLSNTRLAASGAVHGQIAAVSVGEANGPFQWFVPPPGLARKLTVALESPRQPYTGISPPEPSDWIKVKYSSGFVASVPVALRGAKLYIEDYNPLNINNDWHSPDQTYVVPITPLTVAEAKWMHEVDNHSLGEQDDIN
ncbi:MAG: hypothetical protein ACP5O1_04015 [Phycisphaerae bacterium]